VTKSKEKPYTEKARLSTGRPVFGNQGKPMPCRLKLSSDVLDAAGLGPSHEVELIATEGQIIIKRVGGPAPSLPFKSTNAMTEVLDDLTKYTRSRDKVLPVDEAEEPLSDAQRDGEAL
jgi:hypothetical protein